MRRQRTLHALDQSALYNVTSKKRLADALQISLADLKFIISLDGNYRQWPLKQKEQDILAGIAPPSSERIIQQPKAVLDALQKRIATILGRIQKPDYVYSATKGRCYAKNAAAHMTSDGGVKIDIRQFYPSVKERFVRNFFETVMKCAPDVAHSLAKICCFNGALPTGSAVSPVLSFFSCYPMFQRISRYADEAGVRFTLYVDDMVFSGKNADRSFLERVATELRRQGFVGHKIAVFKSGQPKIVTGAAVWAERIEMPNKRQKRIRFFERAFRNAVDPDHVELLGKALLGQFREAERIQIGSRARAAEVETRLFELRRARFGDLTRVQLKRPKKRKRKLDLRRSKKTWQSLRDSVSALRAAMAPPSATAPTEAAGP